MQRGNERGGKTYSQAVKLALQIVSGTKVCYVCGNDVEWRRITEYVQRLLRSAGVFPVKKYMKRLTRYEVKKVKR